MRNPAFKYALTRFDINFDGLQWTHHVQTPLGKLAAITYVVYDLSSGEMFASKGAFTGTPSQNDAGEWHCSTTTGPVNLADIGVVPRSDGTWANVFTWTDLGATEVMRAALSGDLPSPMSKGNVTVTIIEP